MVKARIHKVRLRPRVAPKVAAAETSTETAQKLGKTKRVAGGGPRHSDPEFWTVINDVTDPVPIAPAELDALESYFAAVLDAVFDPARKTSAL